MKITAGLILVILLLIVAFFFRKVIVKIAGHFEKSIDINIKESELELAERERQIKERQAKLIAALGENHTSGYELSKMSKEELKALDEKIMKNIIDVDAKKTIK